MIEEKPAYTAISTQVVGENKAPYTTKQTIEEPISETKLIQALLEQWQTQAGEGYVQVESSRYHIKSDEQYGRERYHTISVTSYEVIISQTDETEKYQQKIILPKSRFIPLIAALLQQRQSELLELKEATEDAITDN